MTSGNTDSSIAILIMFAIVVIPLTFLEWFIKYKNSRYYQNKIMKNAATKQQEYLEAIIRQQHQAVLPSNFDMRKQQEILEQMVRQQPKKRNDSGYMKFLLFILFMGLFIIFYYFYGK